MTEFQGKGSNLRPTQIPKAELEVRKELLWAKPQDKQAIRDRLEKMVEARLRELEVENGSA